MKEYELTIETRQPPCGGQLPKRVEIMEISTDDPVAYVQALEPDIQVEVTHSEDGELVILAEKDQRQVKYSFAEI